MPVLRLFASAREAAGTARAEIDAGTVSELLDVARERFGEPFARVLDASRVWVNGQAAEPGTVISGDDTVAVLPPVSGGSRPAAAPTVRSPASRPKRERPVPRPTGPRRETRGAEGHPGRQLRLVPPPPDDDGVGFGPGGGASPDQGGAGALVPLSQGRLALATEPAPVLEPASDFDPGPLPTPTRLPVARPQVSPQAMPTPVAQPPERRPERARPARRMPSPDRRPQPSPALEPSPAVIPVLDPRAATAPQVVAPPTSQQDPKRQPTLAVVHHSERPHGRLGVLWAVATAGFLVAGPGWLSAWMALVAFVGASQTATVWRKRGERPLPAFAAAMAAGLPIAAAFGVQYMNMVFVGGVALVLVARSAAPTKAPSRDVGLTLAIGVALGLAASSPVILRSVSIPAALFLLTSAAAYDAGAYLVGTGASSRWEGPAAGVAALIPLSMLAAVVLVPPFEGATPLLLGALAAVLLPFGPVAGSALLGDNHSFAPGLRRLDSLLVMGPVWAWCAAALLV